MFAKNLVWMLILLAPLVAFGEGIKTIQLFPSDPTNKFLHEANKIKQVCPERKNDSPAEFRRRNKCYDENMKPVQQTIDLYESADFKSKIVGQIQVTIGLENTTKITYKYGKHSGDYEPDSEGTDDGYSGYYLYTVAAESGDWIQLPKEPFDKPVWINLSKAWGAEWAPKPQPIDKDIYESHLGAIVITKIEGKTFTYRRENEADMNCTGEKIDDSKLNMETFTKDISELYDRNGHLTLRHKYPRGC